MAELTVNASVNARISHDCRVEIFDNVKIVDRRGM